MGNPRKPSGQRGGGRGRGGAQPEEPLHAAARAGDAVAVQSICVSDPLAVNSRDRHSRTPLHLAAWSGHTNIVSLLCKNNADVGAAAMDDMGAIHFAAQKGHLETVRILLSSGVSIKAATRKGFTALHYAAQGSHLDLAKYLVKKGAGVGAKTKAGRTPRDLAESDEMRLFLKECEKKPDMLGDAAANKKSTNSQQDQRGDDEKGDENESRENCEAEKRKGDESDAKEGEMSSIQKKPRVALNHLLAENDTHEEED